LQWQAHRVSQAHRTLATLVGERNGRAVIPPYPKLIANLERIRRHISRPLTLAEKILYSHLHDVEATFSIGSIKRGETYLQLSPERVAMQDASAQMAL
jgi:homoaconitase